jgi:hypothetical protein
MPAAGGTVELRLFLIGGRARRIDRDAVPGPPTGRPLP